MEASREVNSPIGSSRSWLARVCLAAVLAFVVLYVVAAALYPGGTRADPGRAGFSVVHNYWCDLLDETTYGGRHNPARPVALVATIVLCAGLSALWWRVATVFRAARGRAVVIRLAGVASGSIIPLLATRFHDATIDASGLLGAIAFLASMSVLGRQAGVSLPRLGWAALALALTSYLIWRTGRGLPALPLAQKAAFAAFLSWVVALAQRIDRLGATR
jgi:hypothetical protein